MAEPTVKGVPEQLDLIKEGIQFILSFLHPGHGEETATPEEWHTRVHELMDKFGGRMSP